MGQFFVPIVRLDPIERILIFVLMEQFIPFVPVKEFISKEHLFIPMVRLDPVEQILILVPMEQFIPMKQFVPMVQLDATNSNNKF